jgi:SAM-dependent methyltransferase
MDHDAIFIKQHGLSFGAVARLYDQTRPSYPAELFAHIAGHLAGPRVLEVGAGTGKATVGLTALGLEVTCIEPDAAMAAVLAERTALGPPVRIEVGTFETFSTTVTYDGLLSATAWHWTDPKTRMDRAADLLRPGGGLALFWNSGMLMQEGAAQAIHAIYDDFALSDRNRPGEPVVAADFAEMQDPNTWPGDEIAAHPSFEYLGTSLFPWRQQFTGAEYGAFLTSTSWFQVLQPGLRARLLTAVTTTIRDDFDDLVTMGWSTQC